MKDRLALMLAEPGVFDPPETDPARAEQWFEAYRIAKMHADTFSTDTGKELLQHWIKTFLARSIVRPGEDAFAQGIREGQANVVRQVLEQLELARSGPPGGIE